MTIEELRRKFAAGLDANASMDEPWDPSIQTPMLYGLYASGRWDPDAIELFLDHGFDFESRSAYFNMPLISFLFGGVKMSYDRPHGYSAEMEARFFALAQRVIAEGAKLTGGLYGVAADWGSRKWVELLVAQGVEPSHDSIEPWVFRDIEVVRRLLELGADPNGSANTYALPLVTAASVDLRDVIDVLLVAGANPRLRDKRHKTAISAALERGHVELAALLEASTERPPTSADLIAAAKLGDVARVASGLDAGLDVDATSGHGEGRTALYSAAEAGHAEVVRLLLARGADPRRRHSNWVSHTPMCIAAFGDHVDCVVALLEYIEADEISGTSITPLGHAASGLSARCARVLLGAGADATRTFSEPYTAGSTVLMCATQNLGNFRRDAIEVFRLLLEAGADPLATTKNGATVESLLEDPNVYDGAIRADVLQFVREWIRTHVSTASRSR